MSLSIILIPAYIMLAALFPAHDRLVESAVSDTPFEKISQAILLTIFMLGLTRALYARFFQAGKEPAAGEKSTAQLPRATTNQALPPAESIPVSAFGSWRTNSGELAQSRSAGRTTNSLGKE